MKPILPRLIVAQAQSKIGVREAGGNNKGAGLAPFFAADGYEPNSKDDGYAWCAAFVCWVIKTAMELSGQKFSFNRPTTPGAWAFEDWSLAQDASTQTKMRPRGDIQAGDIVIFRFSHIGIATSGVDKDGHFFTVEGNTNRDGSRDGDGVYSKRRHIDLVRSRIRFTV